jgi:hypothetical protein
MRTCSSTGALPLVSTTPSCNKAQPLHQAKMSVVTYWACQVHSLQHPSTAHPLLQYPGSCPPACRMTTYNTRWGYDAYWSQSTTLHVFLQVVSNTVPCQGVLRTALQAVHLSLSWCRARLAMELVEQRQLHVGAYSTPLTPQGPLALPVPVAHVPHCTALCTACWLSVSHITSIPHQCLCVCCCSADHLTDCQVCAGQGYPGGGEAEGAAGRQPQV